MFNCVDQALLDLWHPLCATDALPLGASMETRLLGQRLGILRAAGGDFRVFRAEDKSATTLPVQSAYGFVWTSPGRPKPIFPIPEYHEPDRRNVAVASVGVNVSAPRAIENFLDMGHFPYVHAGILGAEPRTEVKEYDVEISVDRDEILATRCRFFQPMASTVSTSGADVDYIYRVPHPFCSVLYKSSPLDERRMDVICLFLQAMDHERIRAHMLLSILDDEHDDTFIRRFQLLIFGQDKPILENQVPKRLPLDPRAETPIRADKSAIAYRRWLSQKGVTYGVIPSSA
ncbi:aromatic ring-hydroxylating dioxygenase subunit alpha [Mesorhizobium sp.]|uniref:aromatic ring-hydroxylating oxygenase subunit alpha n=1 Tax=Mesorhizobium sp. TaxID=1871066 RepID=UPI0025D6168D|nr:aromatic ring-hydroxylating dioxygenase subunit alpha [Mesorhizobium sp.]